MLGFKDFMQLNFIKEYRYPDHLDGVTVPVLLSYGATSIRVEAKADLGSEVCLFTNEDGRRLGIAIELGIPKRLGSLAGPIEAFGHEVTFQTFEFVFHETVYFAKYPNLPRNILGRQGWLRKLRMAVIDYDNLLYLSEYDS